MKRILLFLLSLASLVGAQAQTFYIGELEYTVTDTENREVSISAKDRDISGQVIIPESVNYEEVEYSVTSIGHHAFYFCQNLTSIDIPSSVIYIGDWAFDECKSLTAVSLPASLTAIEDRTFYNCNSLTSIKLPNSLNSIGSLAFAGCSSLTSIEIPNSVTSIDSGAFVGCSSLTSIKIPDFVNDLGEAPFSGCNSLLEILVDAENKHYCSEDGILFNKDKTLLIQYPIGRPGHYTIPNTVTTIGFCAFYHCPSLTSVTIPNSVTTIHNFAFHGCTKLKSITLPSSISYIGDYVFYTSENLEYIYVEAINPPTLGMGALIAVFDAGGYPCHGIDAIIVVPASLYDKYQSDEVWSRYELEGSSYLTNGSKTIALKYNANIISGIQFDVEIPEGVELSISEEASALMTVSKNEIAGGKTRYVAYTNNGETLPVEFILIASANDAQRSNIKFSNIVVSSNDEPIHSGDFIIDVLGYALEGLTLPNVEEDSEIYLSKPTELIDLRSIDVEWMPYTSDFGTLNGEGIFSATKEGTITDLPLQITDPLVFGPLNATAILNITLLLGDVDRSGTIDIADVVAVVNYILMRDPDPFNFKRADLDGSGDINIADLTRLVKLVLAQPKAVPAQRHARARSAEGEMHLTVPTTGETVDGKRHVYVHLDTDREYTAMQVDLQTTGGARIASINAGPGIDSHVMDHAAIDPTTTRVLLYSHNLASLPAGDHIIDITLADNNADESPDAQLLATSAVSADSDGQAYTHAAATANIGDISTGLQSVYPATMTITTAPGHITVEAPASSTVTITDLQGRILGTWTGTGTLNLSRGLYIVSATNCRPQKVEIR